MNNTGMSSIASQKAASFWRDALPVLLRHSLPLTLILTLLTEAFSALFVSPLVFWTIDALIGLSGSAVVANVGILSFVRSPVGIILIVVGLIGFVFVELTQLAVLSVINVRALVRQPSSLYGVFRVQSAKSGALFRTALALTAMVLVIGVPLVALAGLTYWLLLSGADINYFLSAKPPQFLLAVGIAGVLTVIGLIGLTVAQVRFVFVAPLVMFEGKAGLDALRASNAMVQGHSWRMFRQLLLWFGIALAFLIIGSLLVSATFVLLRPKSSASSAVFAITLAVLFLVIIVTGFVQQVVPPFLHAGIVSQLYLQQRTLLGKIAVPTLPPELDVNAHHLTNHKLRLSLSGALVLFVLALSCLVGLGAQAFLVRPTITIMAHRAGAAEAPENSLTALHRTITQGIASYAEIDVQETADGIVVVIHDSDLRRLAGVNARVWDLPYAQLEQVDIGSNIEPKFVGEHIPSLDAFLDAARGKIKLNIELKYDRAAPLLAGKVVDLVRAKGMQNEVVISSLNTEGLAQVRHLAPELKIGLIYQIEIGSVDRLDVDFLEPEASQVTPSLLDAANARGLPVYVWTIDDAKSAQRMYDAGVSAVITNNPPLVRQALDERSALSDPELILARFRALFAP